MHGRRYRLSIIFLSMGLAAHAQFSYFNKLYNNHGWWEFCAGVVDLGDHYLIAGATSNVLATDSTYYPSLWAFYLDKDGNKGLERNLHFQNGSFVKTGEQHALIHTMDDSFMLCGSLCDTNHHSWLLLLKLDSSLQTVWMKIDSGLGFTFPIDIMQLKDSGYLVCGRTAVSPSSQTDIFMARFDKNGKRSWVTYHGGSNDDNVNSFILYNDTTILLSCVTNGQPYLLNADTTGTIRWQKNFPIQNAGFWIKKSTYGNIIACGAVKKDGLGKNIYGLAARITENAQFIWIDSIRPSDIHSSFNYLQEFPGGTIVVAGRTDNFKAFNGTSIGWVAKFGKDGGLLYEKLYWKEDGRMSDLFGTALTSDGGIICVGTSYNDYEPAPYGQDAWVVKLDTNLCDTPGCYPGVGIGESVNSNNWKIYPNPFSSTLTMETGLLQNGTVSVRLFNMQGTLVTDEQLVQHEKTVTLNTQYYPPGLYILQLVHNGAVVKTQKLFKQP